MLLHDSEHMELHFVDRGGERLLLTFNEMGLRAGGGRFWGDTLAERLGLSAAGFVSRRPNWFPAEDTRRAIAALLPRVAGRFPERVAYGLSQGANAALRFRRELGATVVLAFSPQASIDPADIVDARFAHYFDPALHTDMIPADLPCDAHAPGPAGAAPGPAGAAPGAGRALGPAYVIHDPRDVLDARHVALIRARMTIVEFALPFVGHSSATPFANTSTMRPLIEAALRQDTAAMRAICVAARRRSPSRAYTLCHAAHARRPAATLRLFRAHRDAAPRESWWLVARLLALQGLGWEVIGWLLERAATAPGNAEIQACVAMAAIELEDRRIARRFAAASVALDPAHPTWRWVQGRADAMPCFEDRPEAGPDPAPGAGVGRRDGHAGPQARHTPQPQDGAQPCPPPARV